MLWTNLSRQLNTTQPFAHSPPAGWERESEGQKWKKTSWVEIKAAQ